MSAMKNDRPTRFRDLISFLPRPLAALCCIFALPAHGGDGKTAVESPAITEPSPWQFSSDLELDASYTGPGGEVEGKDITELHSAAQFVLTTQYKDGPPVRFGADWERFTFSGTRGTQIPNTLQSESFIAGIDLQLFSSFFLRLEADPGFYSASSQIRSDSFNIPMVVGGSYLYNKDLQFVVGVSIDPEREQIVLPGGGIRWQINDQWLLNAVLPKPRLEYEMTKQLTIFGGGDILESSYRVGDRFGRISRQRSLNSAWIDYTEIRAGGGTSIKLTDKIAVDLEVGYTLFRDFNFHRPGVELHTNDGGIYAAISIGAKF
jgi:opacity protein-like surface antigen